MKNPAVVYEPVRLGGLRALPADDRTWKKWEINVLTHNSKNQNLSQWTNQMNILNLVDEL